VVEIKETADMDPEAIRAISEIKQTKHGISLKLYNKPKALEDIGRHLGMWDDKLDITMSELPDINLVRGDKGGG
jgi:phage terminase small subunit